MAAMGFDPNDPAMQARLAAIRNDPAKLQMLAQQADPNPILAQLDAQALPPYYAAGNTTPDAASPVNPAAGPNPNIGRLLMGANAMAGPRPAVPQPIHPGSPPALGAMPQAKFNPNPYQAPPTPNIGRLLIGR